MAHGPALGRRLRRLDRRTLARFVAALWAATGWNAAVRGRRVVVRRLEPARERRVLLVVAGYRDLPAALVRAPEHDAVVAPLPAPAVGLLAARAPVIGPETLQERLTYAAEPAARRRLVERFLERSDGGPSRRDALAALAAAGATALAGGMRPPGERSPAVWMPWHPDRNDGRLPTGDGTPQAACEVGPHERVFHQLRAFQLHVLTDPGETSTLSLATDLRDRRPSSAFREAIADAPLSPLRAARSVAVGPADREGAEATVPVEVVTTRGRVVVYEFALRREPGECWVTRSAEVVRRSSPRRSVAPPGARPER